MKGFRHAGLSIFAAILILVSSASLYVYTGGISGSLDCNLLWPEDNKENTDGSIEIRTANDLMKIGKADSHPLDGHYIQMKDIDFKDAVYDEGYLKGFEIELSYLNGQLKFLYKGVIIEIETGAIQIDDNIIVLTNENAECTFTGNNEIDIVAGGVVKDNFQDIGSKTFSVMFSGNLRDITGQKKNSEGNFYPIGLFQGIYDGNFHSIKGIEISTYSTKTETIGVFSNISEAVVKNLDMGGTITAVVGNMLNHGIYIGTMAGHTELSSISNCHTDMSLNVLSFVNGDTVWVGGMFGLVHDSNIEYCYNSGDIKVFAYSDRSTSVSIGGLAGRILSDTNQDIKNCIMFCYNTGNIEFIVTSVSDDKNDFATARVGGIAGIGYDEISNCYNAGSISASVIGEYGECAISAGGIVGKDYGGYVTNCHNNGDITVHGGKFRFFFALGGIIGEIFISTYLNCYNTGILINNSDENDNAFVGGIVGMGHDLYHPTVKNCYFLSENGKNDDLKTCGGEYPKPGREIEGTIENCGNVDSISITNKDNYHEWDFDIVWDMRDGNSPNLRFPVAIEATASEGGTISNKGTTVKPYGDSFEYIFTPDQGYSVLEVVIDDETINEDISGYTFSNVKTIHRIHVTFERIDNESGDADNDTERDKPYSFWIWPYIVMLLIFISALCCWYRDDRKER